MEGVSNSYTFPRAITVKNQTRGGAWIHSREEPWIISNLLTKDFPIETGDQIEVDVDCDDSMIVLETGFALSYNAIVSSDLYLADTQFMQGNDVMFYGGSDVRLLCFRRKFETDLIHTGCSMNGVVSDLYACSIFLETPRYELFLKTSLLDANLK